MDRETLANAVGVNVNTIVRYETGTSLPRIDIAVAMANALDCSCDVLIGVKGLDLVEKE